MRVLGVDPGSSATGFGLIERDGGRLRHLQHGVLRPPRGAALAERLRFLHARLAAILAEAQPEVAVVERVFLAANPHSALVLGQARGALLASLGAAGVRVEEIAPRSAKKAVTGSGAADKQQVQQMVQRLLGLSAAPASDAADALALALSHAQAGSLAGLQLRHASRRKRPSRRALTEFVLERMR